MSSIHKLPPEILNLIFKDFEGKDLLPLSLVSKHWWGLAVPKIWKTIVVYKSSIYRIVEMIESTDFGTHVTNFSLISDSRCIQVGLFKKVLRKLVNITHLTIGGNLFDTKEKISKEINFKLDFDLYRLTSLTQTIAFFDGFLHGCCDCLREILRSAINLQSLNLTVQRMYSKFIPIQVCANLESLSIGFGHFTANVDILDPNHSLLPVQSISNLKNLSIVHYLDADAISIRSLIQRNCKTLEHLDVAMYKIGYKEEDLINLLNSFTELKSFHLKATDFPAPVNLFHVLPFSLRLLDLPINESQIKFLKLHPIPSLALMDLGEITLPVPIEGIEVWDVEIFRYLPKNVKIVRYHTVMIEPLRDLLKRWNSVEQFSKVETIHISLLGATEIVLRDKLVQSFKEVGINLEVKEYDSWFVN